MKTTYDKTYFIAKFEAIPEEEWTTGRYHSGGKSCAAGHCGATISASTPEAKALYDIFGTKPNDQYYLPLINDGEDKRYQQPTPKQRILAALRDLP